MEGVGLCLAQTLPRLEATGPSSPPLAEFEQHSSSRLRCPPPASPEFAFSVPLIVVLHHGSSKKASLYPIGCLSSLRFYVWVDSGFTVESLPPVVLLTQNPSVLQLVLGLCYSHWDLTVCASSPLSLGVGLCSGAMETDLFLRKVEAGPWWHSPSFINMGNTFQGPQGTHRHVSWQPEGTTGMRFPPHSELPKREKDHFVAFSATMANEIPRAMQKNKPVTCHVVSIPSGISQQVGKTRKVNSSFEPKVWDWQESLFSLQKIQILNTVQSVCWCKNAHLFTMTRFWSQLQHILDHL